MYMVRGSELNDFLRCRLRWKWAWIDGLKPRKKNNKLFFGTLFHKFLEVYYSTGNFGLAQMAMDDLATQTEGVDDVEWQETSDLLTHITMNYHNQYYPQDADNWETIATELTFAIPLDDEIGYTGTVDLIVRDKRDGKIYLIDHKTTSSIDKYDKNSDMDRQISRYWWALQQLQQGEGSYLLNDQWWLCRDKLMADLQGEIGGFIYNVILRDYPVPPKVLKNGSLSKAKDQKTTYDLYVKALDEIGSWHNGEPDEQYFDILDHLEEHPKEFFRRVQVYRTQSEINAAIEELYATALDMHKIAYDSITEEIQRKTYRNITADCHWDCQFFDLCKATLDGSNADFLIDALYTKEETNNGI